ncbi:hypothetical protein QR680_004178 [Steinernema hermaphroditum]|uniref:ATP synthase mitochondrial F1 complex assembly factor 2 n=2 Tax=Steinernema hermaphroditum TaxID=289476 RepID=A0AA39HMV8_9BILA|nr:hypothetical protein QR680_004178 [Steinernema hermaphroditum]
MLSLLSKRFASASALVKPRKFYKEASVALDSSSAAPQYQVLLDGRKLRTTAKKVLAVESESLAHAIAHEWNSQKECIDRTHMRLTGLTFTALDNPFEQSKETLVQSIIEYLDTDTILTFADQPERLVALQEQKWSPVIEWANKEYQMDIRPTRSIIEGAYITEESRARLENYLMSQPFWTLIGLQYAVEAVKSVLITLAAASHSIGADQGAELARLEQIFQTEIWGNVEWSHDIEHLELTSRLSSAVLFANLTSKGSSSFVLGPDFLDGTLEASRRVHGDDLVRSWKILEVNLGGVVIAGDNNEENLREGDSHEGREQKKVAMARLTALLLLTTFVAFSLSKPVYIVVFNAEAPNELDLHNLPALEKIVAANLEDEPKEAVENIEAEKKDATIEAQRLIRLITF